MTALEEKHRISERIFTNLLKMPPSRLNKIEDFMARRGRLLGDPGTIRQCEECQRWYDDEFRSTVSPHYVFSANDGHNRFSYHTEAYLSDDPPTAETLQK